MPDKKPVSKSGKLVTLPPPAIASPLWQFLPGEEEKKGGSVCA